MVFDEQFFSILFNSFRFLSLTHVRLGAGHRGGQLPGRIQLDGDVEVGDVHVTRLVQQDVVRLDVSARHDQYKCMPLINFTKKCFTSATNTNFISACNYKIYINAIIF